MKHLEVDYSCGKSVYKFYLQKHLQTKTHSRI